MKTAASSKLKLICLDQKCRKTEPFDVSEIRTVHKNCDESLVFSSNDIIENFKPVTPSEEYIRYARKCRELLARHVSECKKAVFEQYETKYKLEDQELTIDNLLKQPARYKKLFKIDYEEDLDKIKITQAFDSQYVGESIFAERFRSIISQCNANIMDYVLNGNLLEAKLFKPAEQGGIGICQVTHSCVRITFPEEAVSIYQLPFLSRNLSYKIYLKDMKDMSSFEVGVAALSTNRPKNQVSLENKAYVNNYTSNLMEAKHSGNLIGESTSATISFEFDKQSREFTLSHLDGTYTSKSARFKDAGLNNEDSVFYLRCACLIAEIELAD